MCVYIIILESSPCPFPAYLFNYISWFYIPLHFVMYLNWFLSFSEHFH